MAKSGSLFELSKGEGQDLDAILARNGLDARMARILIERPHLAAEMVGLLRQQLNSRTWLVTPPARLSRAHSIQSMPYNRVGWIDASIFKKRRKGYGGAADVMETVHATQRQPVTIGNDLIDLRGDTPIVRSSQGSYWAFNLFLCGDRIPASDQNPEIDINVNVVQPELLKELILAFGGKIS